MPLISREPVLITAEPIRLIGHKVVHTHAQPQTQALWQGFRPRRGDITGFTSADNYNVQQYPSFDLDHFDPHQEYTQWAAAPVTADCPVPDGMQELILPGGLYAVFRYRGRAWEFQPSAQYIYGEWLRLGPYDLGGLSHFEVLGPDYLGPGNPNSEEDVWIPIVSRT